MTATQATRQHDVRSVWGFGLAAIGIVVAVISGIAALAYKGDFGIGDEPRPAWNPDWETTYNYTGFIVAGVIGGFMILLGVILLAGRK